MKKETISQNAYKPTEDMVYSKKAPSPEMADAGSRRDLLRKLNGDYVEYCYKNGQ